MTHCGVFDTAGEGHSAALSAGVWLGAVEVDVQVPVVGPVGSTAWPLERQQQQQQQPQIRQLVPGWQIIGSDLLYKLLCGAWLRLAWVVSQRSAAGTDYRQWDADGGGYGRSPRLYSTMWQRPAFTLGSQLPKPSHSYNWIIIWGKHINHEIYSTIALAHWVSSLPRTDLIGEPLWDSHIKNKNTF